MLHVDAHNYSQHYSLGYIYIIESSYCPSFNLKCHINCFFNTHALQVLFGGSPPLRLSATIHLPSLISTLNLISTLLTRHIIRVLVVVVVIRVLVVVVLIRVLVVVHRLLFHIIVYLG